MCKTRYDLNATGMDLIQGYFVWTRLAEERLYCFVIRTDTLLLLCWRNDLKILSVPFMYKQRGWTALMIASKNRLLSTVNLLLENQASTQIRNLVPAVHIEQLLCETYHMILVGWTISVRSGQLHSQQAPSFANLACAVAGMIRLRSLQHYDWHAEIAQDYGAHLLASLI